MKYLKLFESIDEGSDIEKVEDLLIELIDLGWKTKIEEVHISDEWRREYKQPNNGFLIILEPPFGINIDSSNRIPLMGRESQKDYEIQTLSFLSNHFNKWSEWLSVIPSVLKKLELHVGEINLSSMFGENVTWGGSKWMMIMVKRQKI
jgi:hypothetical protein